MKKTNIRTIKGHVITETTEDHLLTLSASRLTISDLNTFETIKIIELDEMQNLNLVQLIPIGNHMLIFDVQKNRIIYLNEVGFPFEIMFPRKVSAGRLIVTQSDDHKIMFFNSLMYYELDLETKILSEISGVHIMKHYASFRHVMKNLFANRYNYLFFDDKQRKVLYHFHNDEKIVYEDKDFGKPYYFHDDTTISRIGIYDVELQQKQVEFPAPERIAFGGWFGWTDDLSATNSVIKGVFDKDKIVLCYPKAIYVLDLEGKVLQMVANSEGRRFTNLNSCGSEEVLVTAYSEGDQCTSTSKISIFKH